MSTQGWRAKAAFLALSALATLSAAPRASAQWADLRYQYRVPFSINNPTTHAFAAGDLVTASLNVTVPAAAVRPDMADFVVYQGSNPLPTRAVVMGGTVKAVFALPAALDASGSQTGFALYYGGPSAPAIAPSSIHAISFTDGQAHGWKAVGTAVGVSPGTTDPLTSATTLRLDTHNNQWWGWNAAFVGTEMPPMGETTLYTQYHVTAPNQGNAPIVRANFKPGTEPVEFAAPPGVGIFFGWGPPVYTKSPDWDARWFDYQNFASEKDGNYTADNTRLQCAVVSSWDAADGTRVGGKAWNVTPGASTETDPLPGNFGTVGNVTAANPPQPVSTGVVMFNFNAGQNYPGDGSPIYLYYVMAVPSGYCEAISTTAATAETVSNPGPGKAVLEGVAYDAGLGKDHPLAGVAITVKNGSGNTVATYTTDVTGRYRFAVNASATAQTFTLLGQAPGKGGSVTQSVVENTVYKNVDLPIAFGARATGTVKDAGTFGLIPGVTVQALQPGTSNVIAQATTGADGSYTLDVPSGGSYDLAAQTPSYTTQVKAGVSLPGNQVTTVSFTVATRELVPNGGFEQDEAAPDPPGLPGARKPAAWSVLSLGDDQGTLPLSLAISNNSSTLEDTLDETAFYFFNDAARAHGGTHALAVKRRYGIGTGDQSWRLNDLIPVTAGQTYEYSAWTKGTPGFHMVTRLRFASSNEPGAALSNDIWVSTWGTKTDWQRLFNRFTVPAGKSYVQIDLYGSGTEIEVDPGVVYYDDISLKAVAPRPITGTVTDAAGAPAAGVRIGLSASRPGMENGERQAVSNSEGTFTINLYSTETFHIQTWKDTWMARDNGTLDASQETIAPLALKAPNVPAYDFAVGASASTADATGKTSPDLLDQGDAYAFDGYTQVRSGNNNDGGWAGWSQWNTKRLNYNQLPLTLTADMHRAVTFSQVTVVFNWRTAPYWDVQTSNDNAAWTTVYSAEGFGANVLNSSDVAPVVITLPSPVTARYIRVVIRDGYRSEYYWDSQISIWEVRVEAPAAPVAGKVIDAARNPVAGAVVSGQFPNVFHYAQTDATGAYTLNLPIGQTTDIRAHLTTTPDKVVPMSDPLAVTAAAGGSMAPGVIVLGAPQDNLVGDFPSASATGNGADTEPAGNILDKSYDTKWTFTTIDGSPTDASPVILNVDFGAAKTFNQLQMLWEWGYPIHITIEASSDGFTYTPVYASDSFNAGYPFASGKFMSPIRLASPVTAQYLKITAGWKQTQWTAMWELAIANVPANPPAPFAQTIKALRIAGGLASPSGTDMTTLNVVDTGTARIDVADAVALARQGS